MPLTFFDIETEARPREEIDAYAPKEEPFNPAAVKAGNIKDAFKLAEKIEACRLAHTAEQFRALAEFYERAALSPVTGRVLAIGVLIAGTETVSFIAGPDEKTNLEQFWQLTISETPITLVGFNCLDFDLPFMVRRSWLHDVRVPHWLRDGPWWSRSIIDLRHTWTFGDKRGPGTLGDLCQFFGLPPKLGDGKDFAPLFHANRIKALDYLARDVDLLKHLYFRMQQL